MSIKFKNFTWNGAIPNVFCRKSETQVEKLAISCKGYRFRNKASCRAGDKYGLTKVITLSRLVGQARLTFGSHLSGVFASHSCRSSVLLLERKINLARRAHRSRTEREREKESGREKENGLTLAGTNFCAAFVPPKTKEKKVRARKRGEN